VSEETEKLNDIDDANEFNLIDMDDPSLKISERGFPFKRFNVEGFETPRKIILKQQQIKGADSLISETTTNIEKYWNRSFAELWPKLKKDWPKEKIKSSLETFEMIQKFIMPYEVYKGFVGELFVPNDEIIKGKEDLFSAVDEAFVDKELSKVISTGMNDGYILGVNKAGEDIGMGLAFKEPPKEAVDWWNKNAGKVGSKFTDLSQGQIKKDIATGLQQGLSYADTRKLIEQHWHDGVIFQTKPLKKMNPKVWADTVARTEINRATNRGRLDTWKTVGITKKQWLSTIDDRTSAICEELDGQIVSVEKNFSGRVEKEIFIGEAPPAHPNCRSTIIIPSHEVRRIRSDKFIEDRLRVNGLNSSHAYNMNDVASRKVLNDYKKCIGK